MTFIIESDNISERILMVFGANSDVNYRNMNVIVYNRDIMESER